MILLRVLPFTLAFLFLLTNSHGAADVKGIVIYEPFDGATPKIIPFTEMAWVSGAFAIVTTPTSTFNLQAYAAQHIIYLNEDYWRAVDTNPRLASYRSDFKGKEMVLLQNFPTLEQPRDYESLTKTLHIMEELTHRYPDLNQYLSKAKSTLSQEEGKFKQGLRKIDGKWLTTVEYQRLLDSKKTPELKANDNVLITKDGKRYEKYTVSRISQSGVSIIYTEGAATIAFDNLPEDLSFLNEAQKKQLAAAKAAAQNATAPTSQTQKGDGVQVHNTGSSQLTSAEDSELDGLMKSYGEYWEVVIKRKLSAKDFPIFRTKEIYEVLVIGYSPTQFRRRDPMTATPMETPDVSIAIAIQNRSTEPVLAILVTTQTRFTSAGKAEILGIRGVPVNVTMQDGFEKAIPVLQEIEPVPTMENRIRDLLEKSRKK
ncbi:MAG: hypothetical protein B9S32_04185 [Verrucomicrobia bacterium Tous-C9LFEB]|nr:MAG: hypothetical protein B9S32_04185 [Verrucomicrobia bacterium Tous-C9LFEB]